MSVQMMMAGIAAAAMTAALPTSGIGAKSASPGVEAMRGAPTAKPATAKTKYCVRSTITGSRMPRKVCKTRDTWLIDGFDPLADK